MTTATLKASAVSAQEMLAVGTLVGHLGERTKLLSAQQKTKANPTSRVSDPDPYPDPD
jgi:hypothetical protein